MVGGKLDGQGSSRLGGSVTDDVIDQVSPFEMEHISEPHPIREIRELKQGDGTILPTDVSRVSEIQGIE